MRSLLTLALLITSAGAASAQTPPPETKTPADSGTKTIAAPKPAFAATSTVPRRIDVAWKTIPGATRYELWRKLEPKGLWQRLEEFMPHEVSFPDTLVPRVRASYKLVAITSNGKTELKPVGPIEALDDIYVHLKSVKGSRASLFVYMHLAGQWLKSTDPFSLKVGELIGEVDVLGDFRTGAKLIHVGELPTDAKVGRIKYMTKDRRVITVTTVEEPPVAVTGKKPKIVVTKTAITKTAPKSAPKGPKPTTGTVRVLKFPQPRQVGTVPGGKRIVWDIINKSEQRMHFVVMSSKSTRNFFVGVDQTYRVRLPQGGSYTVTVNAKDNKVLPMRGKFGLLEGIKYETKFGIQKVDRAKRMRELKGKK